MTAHAMIQEIPKQSFEKIESYAKELTLEKYIEKQLSQSLSFNVAMLPAELRYQIVVNMFDGNKELANAYYKTPLLYVCKKYHQAHNIALQSFLSKEKTEQLTIELFMLPAQPTKILFNTFNPSFITKLIYDGPVISDTELVKLHKHNSIVNKVFKKRNVLAVNDLIGKNPLLFYVIHFSIMTTAVTLIVFPYFLPILGVICEFTDYCPKEFNYIWFIARLIATLSTFYATQMPSMMKSTANRVTL